MLNPFQQLELIKAEVFTSMPAKFRKKGRTNGRTPTGRTRRSSASSKARLSIAKAISSSSTPRSSASCASRRRADWDMVVQYDGWPNGMKFKDQDGRLYVADYRRGIMVLDTKSGKIEPLLETAYSEGFKGCNDLNFASDGDLYFTDQGQTGIVDPTGRVYRLKPNGDLQRLARDASSPNGITVSTTDKHVYVAVTRSQQIWRLPLMHDGQVAKTGRRRSDCREHGARRHRE